MQVVDLTLEAFDAPNWIMQALLVLLVLGLPVVIAVSWIFDLTPGGVIRTAPRERVGTDHDTLSVLLTLTPAEGGYFDRTFRSTAKMHCERFGARSTDCAAERIIAQFDNAHEALHCAIFLQTRLSERQARQASLVIGEAGSHDRHLVGDARRAATSAARPGWRAGSHGRILRHHPRPQRLSVPRHHAQHHPGVERA